MKPLKLSCLLILLALGLSISSVSRAQNELKNPSPSSGEASQPVQKNAPARKKAAPKDQRGTEQMLLVIKGIPAEKTAEQAAEDRKERDIKMALDRQLTGYTGWQAVFTFVLIVVGTFQLGLFWWQLRLIRESLADTKIAAKAAQDNAAAALEEAKAITLSERAYVKMSHHPPGLNFGPISGNYCVQIRIENCGRTPARITATIIKTQYFQPGESIPSIPDYSGAGTELGKAFLISGDHIGTTARGVFPVPAMEEAIRAGNGRFVVFGYVDYIDQFGARHRAGYAREYDRQLDDPTEYAAGTYGRRSNLTFVSEPDYNYDRKRRHGEGDDWDVSA